MTIDADPIAPADLSAYVLRLLDDHLAAMRDFRDRMRLGGAVSPGARRSIALDTVTVAEQYAERLTRALDAPPR
jgi:hypothetical protein